MQRKLAVLITLGLAGCQAPTADPSKLRPPRPALMVDPAPLPSTPAGAEANPIMHTHVAELRGVCVADQRKTRGLQSWARLVTKH